MNIAQTGDAMQNRFVPKTKKKNHGRNRGEAMEKRRPEKADAQSGRPRSKTGRGRSGK